MTSRSWRSFSRQAAKEKGGIARRIDPQMDASPFHGTPLTGDQVFYGGDMFAFTADIDLDIADRKPELMRLARQRNRGDDRIGPVHGLLHKADDVAVIDRDEPQIGGLLQRRIGPPRPIEIANV